MSMTINSNYAANVAHRNLKMTDAQATSSLAKLSIGTRVVSARDDAASMAVGSRISAEVRGLKQAVVNAGQANSMLQIADGAMGTVSDILTRMKTLAVQSSSGNLSATEREFLDVEFQAMIDEIDRIADDTDFAGTKLIDGAISVTSGGDYVATGGVAAVTGQGIDTTTAASGATFAMSFTSAATGGSFQLTGNGQTFSGTIDSSAITSTGALSGSTVVTLTEGTNGGATVTVALNTAFNAIATHATAAITLAGSTQLDLSFKLGTGIESNDSLDFTLDAINTSSLGLSAQSVDTSGNADAALQAVNTAIDTLNSFRSNVGAAQNRLEFASANLNVSIENAEAARSTLLDLDIASEMSNFTSKQILMQSGVAMLAQANQLPQNLLRLLQ